MDGYFRQKPFGEKLIVNVNTNALGRNNELCSDACMAVFSHNLTKSVGAWRFGGYRSWSPSPVAAVRPSSSSPAVIARRSSPSLIVAGLSSLVARRRPQPRLLSSSSQSPSPVVIAGRRPQPLSSLVVTHRRPSPIFVVLHFSSSVLRRRRQLMKALMKEKTITSHSQPDLDLDLDCSVQMGEMLRT
ncbi:hypothetical protein Ddye_013985 [Dipteronia dyeriana]|uniref:Uncharacterized protein n=1 Tax=Dipteronia dyeriana TaxID=168575 RepID=A0AAE0CK58_9ROSI|nr:hypothetical protein Ddye_013985 [Dipteronia dyeriana]